MRYSRLSDKTHHRRNVICPVFMVLFIITIYFVVREPPEEVIHLVYMLGGNTYSRHFFYTQLKSLLSFSNATLHLHIVADSENIEDVRVLLKTWGLSRCQYTFYDEKNYAEKISWLPSTHYSKQYGYLKLEIPFILSEIDKAIFLDVDLIFLVDVRELWNNFKNFNQTNFLGMAPVTSDWYLVNPQRWPAIRNILRRKTPIMTIFCKDENSDVHVTSELKFLVYEYYGCCSTPEFGRGFNSGLNMYDLKKMRDMGWDNIWMNLTRVYLPMIGANPINDQDIFNTYAFENPEIIRPLNCSFNFELGWNANEKLCPYPQKLIHFNTNTKAARPGMEKFLEVRQSFFFKDGGVLKRQRDGMSDSNNSNDNYRILPNAYGRRSQSESCFRNYLNASKLETFVQSEAMKNTTFPMVIVLFGTDAEVTTLAEKVNSLHREDITIHCVYGSSFNRKLFLDTVVSYSNCGKFLETEDQVGFEFRSR